MPAPLSPDKQKQNLVLVGFALSIGAALATAVFTILTQSGTATPSMPEFGDLALYVTLGLVAVACATAWSIVPGAFDETADSAERGKSAGRFIIGLALIEGQVLLSAVGLLLTGALALLAPALIGVATMLLLTLRFANGTPHRG